MRVDINYKTSSDMEYTCVAETEIRGERHFGIGKSWDQAKENLLKKLDGYFGQVVPAPETVEIKVVGEEMDGEILLWDEKEGRVIEAGKL